MAIKIPIITEYNGSGVNKALKQFAQLEGAGSKMSFAFKAGMLGAAGAVGALGTATFQAGQAMLGFAKLAGEDQKAALQLAQSIKGSTKATDTQIKSVEDWIDVVQRATGVADDDLRPAFARLVRSTHDVKAAQDLMRTALDVSAATGRDLGTVSNALGKAMDGSTTALAKLGLGYDKAYLKATPFAEVLKDLDKRFSGSALENAKTYEGTMARFSIAVSELKEGLGYAILPALQRLADMGSAVAGALGRNGAAGAISELKFQLSSLLYDPNGNLNQVGKTLNELSSKANILSTIFNFVTRADMINNTIGRIPGVPNIGAPSLGSFGETIDPSQFRTIRGATSGGINVYIQTGIGDPVAIGRQVYKNLQALERRNGGRG